MAFKRPKVSQKVDLTLNRDFSRENFVVSNFDIVSDESFGWSGLDAQLTNPTMSRDEYEEMYERERIFGRRYHYNEIMSISLKEKDDRFLEELRTHCERCGCEIRVPWNSVYGLCRRCNDAIENNLENNYDRIPWKIINNARDTRDTAREIFTMR